MSDTPRKGRAGAPQSQPDSLPGNPPAALQENAVEYEPLESNSGKWAWFLDGHHHRRDAKPHDLPIDLFDALPDDGTDSKTLRRYNTRAEALQALAEAQQKLALAESKETT